MANALVIWADDVVLLGAEEDPQKAPLKLQHTAVILVEELLKFGLMANFDKGKSEAIITPRGKGSQGVRRLLFNTMRSKLPLQTAMPGDPCLRLVPRYKHVGGLVTFGAKMRPEIAHRAAQALQLLQLYKAKVFRNKTIGIPARMAVLRSTALTTLHYNAGIWSRLTQFEEKMWHTIHLKLYRAALTGLHPYKEILHMTDEQVLIQVAEPVPKIRLRTLRLRWYGGAIRRDCPQLWAILAWESQWLEMVQDDLQWLYGQIHGYTSMPDPTKDLQAWHTLMASRPRRWAGLIKRAELHDRLQWNMHASVTSYHRRAIDILRKATMTVPDATLVLHEASHHCFCCGLDFPTFRAWAVHSFKKHGRINKWRRLQTGSECLACGRIFPSSPRLIRHLRSVQACARKVAALQLWVEPAPAFGSKQVTQEEATLCMSMWMDPTTDHANSQDGDIQPMTLEAHTLLQVCRRLDWSQQQTDNILLRLQDLPISSFELTEIEQTIMAENRQPEQQGNIGQTFATLHEQARPDGCVTRRELTLHECISSLQALPTTQAPAPQRIPTKWRYVLHLYSGVRRQGDFHSILENLKTPAGFSFYVASVDLVLDPILGDLLCRRTQDFWLDMAAQGAVFGFLGGPPCESWSIARFRFLTEGSGPRPLRCGEDLAHQIWGLRVMRIRDINQVNVANELLLFTILMVLLQWITGGIAVLEHPECPERKCDRLPPSIWLLPLMRFIVGLDGIHVLHISQGFWGAISPKPTALLTVAPGASRTALVACLDSERVAEKLPPPLHMRREAHGFSTAALKRYPPALCAGIAAIFNHMAQYVNYQNADEDAYEDTFHKFAHAYRNSHDTIDGADYVPQNTKLGATNPPVVG